MFAFMHLLFTINQKKKVVRHSLQEHGTDEDEDVVVELQEGAEDEGNSEGSAESQPQRGSVNFGLPDLKRSGRDLRNVNLHLIHLNHNLIFSSLNLIFVHLNSTLILVSQKGFVLFF